MLLLSCYFGFGACWASFVTTMTSRHLLAPQRSYPPYSICEHCHHRLHAWQLCPISGWLSQGGRCYWCHCRLSALAPVTEALTGGSWAVLAPNNFTNWLALLLVSSGCLMMVTTDWQAQWITPPCLVSFAGLLVLTPVLHHWLLDSFLALLWLSLTFAPGFGRGDGEWLAILTLVIGARPTCAVILLGCLLALSDRRLWHHQPIPLIPYLTGGLWLTLLTYPTGWPW